MCPPGGSSPVPTPRLAPTPEGCPLLPLGAGGPATRFAVVPTRPPPSQPTCACPGPPALGASPGLGCGAVPAGPRGRGQASTAPTAGWPPALSPGPAPAARARPSPLGAQAFVPASTIGVPVATQATYCGCLGRARKRPGPAERPRRLTCCRGLLTGGHRRAKPRADPAGRAPARAGRRAAGRAGTRARGSGPSGRSPCRPRPRPRPRPAAGRRGRQGAPRRRRGRAGGGGAAP